MSDTVIKHASSGKRAGAFLIDIGLSLLVGFATFILLGEKVIMEKGHYFDNASSSYLMIDRAGLGEAVKSEYDERQYTKVDLYVPAKGTVYNAINVDGSFGYKNYEDVVVNFFVDFLPNACEQGYVIKDAEKMDLSYFNKEWLGLSVEADATGSYGHAYYMPGKDASDELSLSVRPALRPEVESALNAEETKEETAKNLLDVYYKSQDANTLYHKALLVVLNSESYQKFVSDANMTLFYAEIPSFLLPLAIFFVLIPLLMPNGETVGKKLLSVSLISKDGYTVKKWQTLLHYVPFIVLFLLLLIPGYINMLGFAVLMLLAIDYMVMIMQPEHMAIEDKLARTLVVDKKESAWFLNAEDEKNHESVEKKMENNPSRGLFNTDALEVESKDVEPQAEETSETTEKVGQENQEKPEKTPEDASKE